MVPGVDAALDVSEDYISIDSDCYCDCYFYILFSDSDSDCYFYC